MSDEITRIHQRLDEIQRDTRKISETVAVIQATMPTQPCQGLVDLQEDRKDTKRAGLRVIATVVAVAIASAAATVWAAIKTGLTQP